MKSLIYLFVLCLSGVGVIVIIGSCNKNDKYELITPGTFVHFNGGKNQNYTMNVNPPPKYQIGVGTTDVAATDRTVTYKVTSPTGAVAGTHYTITPAILTIPAGQTTANIDIQGIYAQYTSGRKDTLIFTLSDPSVKPATFNDTVKLAIKGPCFDGDVTATTFIVMAGNYTDTKENGSYGPYTTSISGITALTATTGRAVINNLYDYFGPININFDWTNPLSTNVDIPLQITNQNYAAGQPFYVRTHTGSSNKFSFCNQTFDFELDVLVLISGLYYYYDQQVVYTMRR